MNRIFVLVCLMLWNLGQCISKYDFNVCRMDFCNDKESACVADEDICMDNFASTRKWYIFVLFSLAKCENSGFYNECWVGCKRTVSSTLYENVVNCYENLCYLGGKLLSLGIVGVSLIVTLGVMMGV